MLRETSSVRPGSPMWPALRQFKLSKVLFGVTEPRRVRGISRLHLCQPQVASMGLPSGRPGRRASSMGSASCHFRRVAKLLAVGEPDGFVKLIIGEPHGEILGAHIIGADATEMIAELGPGDLDGGNFQGDPPPPIHAHPTLSEAVHEAAHASHGHAIHF